MGGLCVHRHALGEHGMLTHRAVHSRKGMHNLLSARKAGSGHVKSLMAFALPVTKPTQDPPSNPYLEL